MKKILITILLLFLTGCVRHETGTINFGADIDTATAQKMEAVITNQKSFQNDTKYQYVAPTKIDGTDITYWVTEYIDGGGKKGYQVYYKKSDGSIMSTGEGSESIRRSFDWTPVFVSSSSTKEKI